MFWGTVQAFPIPSSWPLPALPFRQMGSHHCCSPPSGLLWHTSVLSLFWLSSGSLAFHLAEVAYRHLYRVRQCSAAHLSAFTPCAGRVLPQHPSSPAIWHFSISPLGRCVPQAVSLSYSFKFSSENNLPLYRERHNQRQELSSTSCFVQALSLGR